MASIGEKVATNTKTNKMETDPTLTVAIMRLARLEEIIRPTREFSSSR
jgi:hypothetical protein